MRRIDAHWALLAARLSALEACALRTGLMLLVFAAASSVFMWDARGYPRVLGLAGLASLVLCAASRAVRMYRAGARASLPASVGRTHVRIHPARGFVVSSVVLGLGLPLIAAVAVLAAVDWAWLLVAGVVLIGGAGIVASRGGQDEVLFCRSSATADAVLQRLCMRADMPVPELVVMYDAHANAWTSRGRVHVTDALLELLDVRELEAVLAHELAHLARRDAAAMEICSAPSRVLLGFSALVSPRLVRWTRGLFKHGAPPGIAIAMWVFALMCVPAAFVIGWVSRLSVLGMSRARELAADAAAATLTGSPSALASALLKLDGEMPSGDLRQAETLCIVATRSRRSRWLSTHPPTAVRVERLEALEVAIQTRRRR